MKDDQKPETKTISIPPQVFADKQKRTIGKVFEDIGVWGLSQWRTDRESRATWKRLERLPWGTVNAEIVIEVRDLQKLAAILLGFNLNGPDTRPIVRMFNVILDAAQPEKQEHGIDDLDLEPRDAPDQDPAGARAGVERTATNGAAPAQGDDHAA